MLPSSVENDHWAKSQCTEGLLCPEQKSKHSEYELKTLRNIQLNLKMLRSLGFCVQTPAKRIIPIKGRQPMESDDNPSHCSVSSDSDSDPEWVPSMDWEFVPVRHRQSVKRNNSTLPISQNKKSDHEDTREKASTTVPHFLHIRQSKIPGAGLGVWTKLPVNKSIRFGPYKGEITADKQKAELSGYAWKIGGSKFYVDAKDEYKSNWLRYVNCCRKRSEQNLIAYQYNGEIFYKTIREIPANRELLVWYGEEYGVELNISNDDMYSRYLKPYEKGKPVKRCMQVADSGRKSHALIPKKKKLKEAILKLKMKSATDKVNCFPKKLRKKDNTDKGLGNLKREVKLIHNFIKQHSKSEKYLTATADKKYAVVPAPKDSSGQVFKRINNNKVTDMTVPMVCSPENYVFGECYQDQTVPVSSSYGLVETSSHTEYKIPFVCRPLRCKKGLSPDKIVSVDNKPYSNSDMDIPLAKNKTQDSPKKNSERWSEEVEDESLGEMISCPGNCRIPEDEWEESKTSTETLCNVKKLSKIQNKTPMISLCRSLRCQKPVLCDKLDVVTKIEGQDSSHNSESSCGSVEQKSYPKRLVVSLCRSWKCDQAFYKPLTDTGNTVCHTQRKFDSDIATSNTDCKHVFDAKSNAMQNMARTSQNHLSIDKDIDQCLSDSVLSDDKDIHSQETRVHLSTDIGQCLSDSVLSDDKDIHHQETRVQTPVKSPALNTSIECSNIKESESVVGSKLWAIKSSTIDCCIEDSNLMKASLKRRYDTTDLEREKENSPGIHLNNNYNFNNPLDNIWNTYKVLNSDELSVQTPSDESDTNSITDNDSDISGDFPDICISHSDNVWTIYGSFNLDSYSDE